MIIKLNLYKGQLYNIGGIIELNYTQSYEDEKNHFCYKYLMMLCINIILCLTQ